MELSAPKGGMLIADLTSPPQDQTKNYVASKTGNWFLASELARKVGPQGIFNVVQNPGNLKTNLIRHAPVWMRLAASPLLHNAKQGAYTELWAGLSPELTMDTNEGYVIPWGRVHRSPRQDLLDTLMREEEGGTGEAGKFREWCQQQTAKYVYRWGSLLYG